MEFFLKAVFLLLLTGPSTVSKRLNKKALSEASIVEDSQPTPVGAQTNGDEAKAAGRKRDAVKAAWNDPGRFIHNAVKGAEKWRKKAVKEVQKHYQPPDDKKKMRQMTAAEQAGGTAAAEGTQMEEADHFTSHIPHLQDEASQRAAEEPQEEPETPPAPPASPEEKFVASAALTPAEEAKARWSEASPSSEAGGQPEESGASPAADAAEESADHTVEKSKSFAHLSTAPVFSVFAVALAASAVALEIAGAK